MGDSLNGLVVLISGASSGLGQGIAAEYAKYKPLLALTGRSVDRLEETKRLCIKNGLAEKDIYLIAGDVTAKDDVERIVCSTVSHFGKLDILINNAGATRARNIDTCEIEDLDWCYNVLVRSVFMMTKAALPYLKETKGAIINMSSLAGLRPLSYALPYSMCKCMVDRFTQASAVALGAQGIRINCINPATVKTAMFEKPEGPGGNPDRMKKYLDWCCAAIPLGRIGEVEEVARLAAFLGSKQAKFITGTLFPIDGSYSNTSYIPSIKH